MKISWIKFCIFCVCSIVTFLIIFNWTIVERDFLHHDQSILHELNNGRVAMFDSIFILITNTSSYLALGFTAIVFIVSFITRSPVLRKCGWQLLFTFLVAFIVIKSLKYSIDRIRPFDKHSTLKQLVEIDSPSFPSGHTLESAAMATTVILLFSSKALWAIAIAWALAVAFSRILLAVHYPSDVLAGIVLGILVSLLCHWVCLKIFPSFFRDQPSGEPIADEKQALE
jgi:membrane-associated phospholipid phosphatase